ncbi:MAG: putative porin [Bacteroidales bacterium]|nr:putative porin [Bacteroidales bacterium]
MKHILLTALSIIAPLVAAAKGPVIAPSRAWGVTPPLGERISATIDTLHTNYAQETVPSEVSDAYATTANFGAEGYNMIYFDRKPYSDFFFRDALSAWLPSESTMRFYNTRIPMTLLSYNTGGSRETTQDRLKGTFSGNVNPKAQIGALIDYIYSKGSYDYQAAKNLIWGFSGSYIGDHFEFQGYYNHYNSVNKENGGITDDRYITDPAAVQGGDNTIDTKAIPTYLTAAHSRVKGGELWLNSRYKLGFWRERYDEETDTLIGEDFIPVTSVIWTLKYNNNSHEFINTSEPNDRDFWKNTYLSTDGTHDLTRYWGLRNTVGLSLMEGFNKYAKAGLTAFVTHEIRKFTQMADSIPLGYEPVGLTPYPYDEKIAPRATENYLWIGAQLARRKGFTLNYSATAELGIAGRAVGEVKVDGNVDARIRLLGDTVKVGGYVNFSNTAPQYLLNNYVSNHFIWHNNFSKTRRLRAGGGITIPHTHTYLTAGVENIQNLIYFDSNALPTQYGGNIQVFSARLHQDFHIRALHWENRITYQTTSNATALPLPNLAVYSNLYVTFKVATLHVQLGIDCDYYTKYKSVAYQPATMTFYNQQEYECGNYPFMNAYINMKLSKTRFYVMMSHVNQGLTGSNYFSMPGYPLNPRRFQLGLSVDFAN